VLNAPSIQLTEYYLDLKVWKGEHMPQTDMGGKCGTVVSSEVVCVLANSDGCCLDVVTDPMVAIKLGGR